MLRVSAPTHFVFAALLILLPLALFASEESDNPAGAEAESYVYDEAEVQAPEEPPSPTPSAVALKQAENIDLKEVVLEPMETPPTPPVEKVTLEVPKDASFDEQPIEEPLETPEPETLSIDPEVVQEPLVLLDNEVPAGTSTRLSWSPDVSFMGISAPSAVLVVHGLKPGPTVCLTAAIHGDELNGIEVVRHVLYSIDPAELAGTVIGVPIVNLQGFRRSSRYLPDRRDLNRYFPGNAHGSSASRIASSFFDGVVRHCDMLVDLHTGSFRRTNLPQLRADLTLPRVADLAKKMGSIVVVHSEGTPGCLRRASVEFGIPAVTLEAGQPQQLQKTAVNHGIKSVKTLLDNLGMLDRRQFWQLKAEPIYYKSQWVRAISGGILFSEVELGDRVAVGEILGVITDPITNQRHEVIAPYNGRVIGMALNQVMYPGFAAYHIGLQSSVEAVSGEEGEGSGFEAIEAPLEIDAADVHEEDELDSRIMEDS
ncbi:succinylglutamate desuccinylase/aspartoacylase family protein [Teredinibacter haidensis]|uniref:succinylglutamate desuccinylase/aspartoacylase family protein n=1 Tax=Teredinibacter haidensis TaxID=2731755 RepID=UPI000948C1B7|nr:succinylglutamate desuccinylase/aspartoacylase family protein [Teredinibacter haidensis]